MLQRKFLGVYSPALYGWSLAAVLATVVAWPVVFHNGIPAFFHDWTWSPFRDRMVQSWQLLVSAWSQSGIGRPNSVPTLNPLAWLKVGLAAALPGDASAKAYLWLSLFAGCAGVYRLARRSLRLDPSWAAAAASMFAGSPFLFAKIASGQSSEWAAVAAFAWGLSLAIDAFESGDLSLAAGAALLFAASTNQLQFLVFSELAALAGLIAYRRRRSFVIWSIIAVGTTAFALPALWFLAERGPLFGADVSPPYRAWEYSQSSSIGDAIAQIGYSARYPETFIGSFGPWALPVVKWALWAIAALSLAGCVIQRSGRAYALAALGVVGILWVSGIRGPAAGVWEWLFARTSLVAFLREFFHGAALVDIACSALAAAALQRIALYRRSAALCLGVILVACSGAATWLGGLGPTLPHVTAPAYEADLEQRLPKTEARVMFLPPERPLYVRDDAIGGVDAFDWAGPRQQSLFEYYPSGPLAFAALALDRADFTDARRVLSRVACDAIVWRPDVTSPLWHADYPTAPASSQAEHVAGGALLFDISAPAIVSGARAAAPMPSALNDLSPDPSIVYLDVPGKDSAAGLPRDLEAPDPATGWVGYRDLYHQFEDGLSTPTLGIVTTKSGASITLPGTGADILLWAPRGAVVDGRRMVAPKYERVRTSGPTATIEALGTTAVGEIGERPVVVNVHPSSAEAVKAAPWRYAGSSSVSGSGLLILRQRFDPGWVARVDGMKVAAHYRADGTMNAWLIDGTGSAHFEIEYAPQSTAFALLAVSLSIIVTLVCIGWALRRR